MQVILIILTMFFGAVFLGVKAVEYTDKYNHGLIPVAGLNKDVHTPAHDEHAAPAAEHAPKPCWEVTHGEVHEYINPRGEFQWTDCSLAKLAVDEKISDALPRRSAIFRMVRSTRISFAIRSGYSFGSIL